MKVISLRLLAGPNIYSFKPVLRAQVAVGKYENISSAQIPHFNDSLVSLLPGLREHYCSRGCYGGFVARLQEGTYMAHIFEHVAIELQTMAGYNIKYGKTRGTGLPGIYQVIMGLSNGAAALEAAKQAEKLILSVLGNQPFDPKQAVDTIQAAAANSMLGPSTEALFQAAKKRKIPVTLSCDNHLLLLGYGCEQKKIWATITSQTSSVAVDISCDKQLTKQVLTEGAIPVPYGKVVTDFKSALAFLNTGRAAIVAKPVDGNQGKGVTVNIKTSAELKRAFQYASEFGSRILVEENIEGNQYRVLVVDGKMVAAAMRVPAQVQGDGEHTISQLVEMVNQEEQRGYGHEKPLTQIKLDSIALMLLAKKQYTVSSVPLKGEVVYLRDSANLSTGGTAVDVTEKVHLEYADIAERASRLVGLDVAGVDIMCKDISLPYSQGGGAVIEVNAAPGIRMHHYPNEGKSQDVAGQIIDYLFPNSAKGRIPIFSITGTNGKTTVTRMIGHILQQAGFYVGMTTTDGIYINGTCVQKGDTTGPTSAKVVLNDPKVNVAVLETARGGIVRSGLAFETCDVGIVTNITEDHIGQDGIENLEDLAFIKSLIVESVSPKGVALLNADDKHVAAMAPKVKGNIVYFSIEPDNIVIKRHLGVGGQAFFVKKGYIYAASGDKAKRIAKVADIPVTFGGIALQNLQNAVIAAAACYSAEVPLTCIKRGLSTFATNPGRLMMLPIGNFRVCVDYGHNPASYKAMINTVAKLGAKRLIGVIAAPGDRRDDVIINTGKMAGKGFDSIYIKEDNDLRGRLPGETAKLLKQGVLAAGMDEDKVQTILFEVDAVNEALCKADEGDLIVIFYEKYHDVVNAIEKFKLAYEPKQKNVQNSYSAVRMAGGLQI